MPSAIIAQPTFLHDINWYKLELVQECKKNERLIKAHALEISVLKKNHADENSDGSDGTGIIQAQNIIFN